MRYFMFYESNRSYILPNQQVMTSVELEAQYPALNHGKCVIETNSSGSKLYSIDLLVDLKDRHNIDPSLSDEEALQVITDILNAPAPEAPPTAEERIAAALEYQNLMSY